MTDANTDYSSFIEEDNKTGDTAAKLTALTDELTKVNAEIADHEEKLKHLNTHKKQLMETKFPEATGGVEGKFDLPNGSVVTLKSSLFTNIPPDNKPQVIDWLLEQGHDAIIKCSANFEFGKGERDIFAEFIEFTKQFEHPLKLNSKEDVHYQTLQSFVRERVKQGETLPDLFGLFRKFDVKIKPKS